MFVFVVVAIGVVAVVIVILLLLLFISAISTLHSFKPLFIYLMSPEVKQ